MLHANDQGKRLSRFAGQILTDVSAAFGHVFSLMQEKIGEASERAYGMPLTCETVDAAAACDASLLLAAPEEDARKLQDAMNLAVEITSFCVPAALCGRHESPASLWIAQALAMNPEILNDAAVTTFRFAMEQDAVVSCVPPSGVAAKETWEAALTNARNVFPGVRVLCEAPGDAMRRMLLSPADSGVVFCPPYAGGIFGAAAGASCVFPNIAHSYAFGEQGSLFAAGTAQGRPNENPFSLAFAIAKLLRYALKLENEAACVEAAVTNVLLSGWRTEDFSANNAVPSERIIELICEQISVAGELMNKGAFSS